MTLFREFISKLTGDDTVRLESLEREEDGAFVAYLHSVKHDITLVVEDLIGEGVRISSYFGEVIISGEANVVEDIQLCIASFFEEIDAVIEV